MKGPPEIVTITITPTTDDLVEYALYKNYRCPLARRARRERYVTYSIVLIAVIAGIAWRASQPGGLSLLLLFTPLSVKIFFSILGVVVIGAFLWPVIANMPPVIRWIAHRRIRRCPALFWQDLERREVTIEDRGIRTTGDGFASFVPWNQVRDVLRDRDRAYIGRVSEGVEIVRENMFASREQFQEFIATIRQYRLAAVTAPSEAAKDNLDGIVFTPTSDDLAALLDYFSRRFPGRRRTHLVVVTYLIFCMVALTIWIALSMIKGWWSSETELAMFIAVVVWLLLVMAFTHLLVGDTFSMRKRLIQSVVGEDPLRNQLFHTPIRVCLESNGMRDFVNDGEEFVAWRRIPKVVNDNRTDRLFICTIFTVHNINAVVIPRCAFDSEFAFADFCHQAETLWQAGHDDAHGAAPQVPDHQ